MGQATSELRLITHHTRKATLKLCTSLDTEKKRKEKQTRREERSKRNDSCRWLQFLRLLLTSSQTPSAVPHTPLAATRRHSIVCVSAVKSVARSVVVFLLFLSHCLFLTNLQAQGCITHHGSIHSDLARRERHAQLQRSQRSQAAQKAVQDRAAKSRRKEAEA